MLLLETTFIGAEQDLTMQKPKSKHKEESLKSEWAPKIS